MARDFDGSADYFSQASIGGAMAAGTAFSFVAWAKTDSIAAGTGNLFDSGTGTAYQFQLRRDGASLAGYRAARSGSFYDRAAVAASQFTAGTWHHLGYVYDGSVTFEVYRDGVSRATNNQSGTNERPGDDLRVGANLVSGSNWDGALAEVAIYGVALSTADMEALNAGMSPLLVRSKHLQYYWPLFGRGGASANEEDWASGAALTQNSSPALADHPRIIYPRRRTEIWVPPVSSGAPSITALSAISITATSAQPRISYS